MATVKLFRCDNPKCQALDRGRFTSELEKPPCPQCKYGADHPRFAGFVHRIARVHFDPPSDIPGYGLGVRACDVSKPIAVPDGGGGGAPNPYHAGTGVPEAVTCPECMATPAFKSALERSTDEDAVDATVSRIQEFAQTRS